MILASMVLTSTCEKLIESKHSFVSMGVDDDVMVEWGNFMSVVLLWSSVESVFAKRMVSAIHASIGMSAWRH